MKNKKRWISIILILLLTCMVMLLVACEEDDNEGGVLPSIPQNPGINQPSASQQVQSMPASTDEAIIENAIDQVFGVDFDLPQGGTYSAQSYSYEGTSVYAVTVSGTNQTTIEYYNSIKANMIANGYTAEDSDLVFYKNVGTTIYSVGIEEEAGNIVVYTGVSEIGQGLVVDPNGGVVDPGTTELPSGDLSAWPTATVNNFFSEVATQIPAFTWGTSYSVTENSLNGDTYKSIKVTCYGATRDENDLYKQSLIDAGWQSSGGYYYYSGHNVRGYGDIGLSINYHPSNEWYSYDFTIIKSNIGYTMPQNLKVVWNYANVYTTTAIMIGKDYYMKEETKNYSGSLIDVHEIYYKYNGSSWVYYTKDSGCDYDSDYTSETYGQFIEGTWSQATPSDYDIENVDNAIFDFVTSCADIYEDEAVKQDEQVTIAGRVTDVWVDGNMRYYKDAENGLILKYDYYGSGYEITSYDESITSFDGIELPVEQ